MGVQETSQELWGGETRKAMANFPVSGERVPVAVVRWLGRIKGTAARVNAELGLLDGDMAERIAADGTHANDHVNMGQSSNDAFPSAVHLAALDEATHALLPALEKLEASFARKSE